MSKTFGYYDDWKSAILECPECGWKGTFKQGYVEYYADLMDSSCPKCDPLESHILAIVEYPTIEESRANWDKVSDLDRKQVELIEQLQANFNDKKLREPSQLPDIHSSSFILHWDFLYAEINSETLIKHGDTIIFREPAIYEGYERFIKVAHILRERYGTALLDLVPTDSSKTYLYGDCMSAQETVTEARKKIFSDEP